ncbi:CPBP family intramembrane glutamic endopeptidase [Turneriella parva]|uniref:Abortive infection protein n=1 Tax=Turneriella parva (strain ATCC BAA-1111 / DSM 21527 / NCTC 11395 / H) TaxID=869212 RepID=I4B7Z1_TURPD|nr:CPBP family intramembrane glutamic endopeptidase [Turneriella parva]AFM13398.1 Abortive infection protein [Turneriella parva DSM 21527]
MQPSALRPLWLRYLSIPLYLIAVMLLTRAIISLQGRLIPAATISTTTGIGFMALMYSVIAQMVAFLLPAPLLLYFTGGRNYTYRKTDSRYLVIACALILLVMVLFSLLYAVLDTKPSQLAYLDMKDILKNRGAFLVLTSVVVPAYEEWVFRGLFFGVLVTDSERSRDSVIAGLFVSLIFSAVHVEGAHSLTALPPIFAMSLVLHAMTFRSGSLWPAFCAHSLQNLLAASTMLAAAAKTQG